MKYLLIASILSLLLEIMSTIFGLGQNNIKEHNSQTETVLKGPGPGDDSDDTDDIDDEFPSDLIYLKGNQ